MHVHRQELKKPDGRSLTLYARRPIGSVGPVMSPRPGKVDANPHLRWHPLRATWVAYAAYRQDRTFLPPPEYNPLLPSADANNPTELPIGEYDIAVFDNLFPTLALTAHDPPAAPVPTRAANGHCEVVVYTQDPGATLGQLPIDHLALLVDVWGDRTARIGEREAIRYVMPFENRGVEVGVTLHHPHGQIYAYPFVPAIPQQASQVEREYYAEHQRPMLTMHLDEEQAHAERVVYEGPHAIAFVPAWARYPYEVWIAPRIAVAHLYDLTDDQKLDLARALKTVLLKYDGLWQMPFPYVMAWYQAPTDGLQHPEAHLHAEFYPAYRTRGRLKYLAGTEIAAGMFANDALPEEKARELRAVPVDLGST